MLTDASRYGKRRKYTLKDINVEQETAEVTNRHEKKLASWGTAIISGLTQQDGRGKKAANLV